MCAYRHVLALAAAFAPVLIVTACGGEARPDLVAVPDGAPATPDSGARSGGPTGPGEADGGSVGNSRLVFG